jgi:orotate phosphoribosyltransferase
MQLELQEAAPLAGRRRPKSHNVPMGSDLAARVHAAAHLEGSFRLRSGRVASEYFDKYRFESDPALLRDLAEVMATRVPDGVDGLAGLELGGVPLATALSLLTGLPAYFVRKEAKKYGTERVVEGGEVDGQHLLVVEDVVTTGGQVILSTDDLRSAGATITDVLCVVDRESGAREHLASSGIELHALFTMSELNEAGGRAPST